MQVQVLFLHHRPKTLISSGFRTFSFAIFFQKTNAQGEILGQKTPQKHPKSVRKLLEKFSATNVQIMYQDGF